MENETMGKTIEEELLETEAKMIKQSIDGILDTRHKKAEALKEKKQEFNELQKYLKELHSYRSGIENVSNTKIKDTYRHVFESIHAQEMGKTLSSLISRIDSAVTRFERDRISIATVGKARQGKSTFLQSVGNLDDDIIPAYDTGDCTGATSVIYNVPEMAPGTVSAYISFKRKEEIVDIIKAYINQINPSYLSEKNIEFSDIAYLDIVSLEKYIKDGEAEKSTALKHLKNIVENLEEIQPLLGSSPITLTEPSKIKEYVAQNNGKEINDFDREDYHKYIAVAKAEISCHFYNDCGKIVLVDTIGLGDTQVGIEDAMLNTVDRECDAAIVVTKPITVANQQDMGIYKLLREKFEKRNMKEWLFYVANHHEGVNTNIVNGFKESVSNGNFDICFCETVDCSNKIDVNKEFMQPLLKKLINNIDSIDNAYLDEIEKEIEQLKKKFVTFINNLPSVEQINPNAEAALKAYKKGQETYERMTAQLKDQVLRLRKEKNQPNGALWNRVQVILNRMDNLAPTSEQLQKIIDTNGAIAPARLWELACSYVRNEITDSFNKIDEVMEKETISFKNSLVEQMYYALGNLFAGTIEEENDNDVDMLTWLKNMMDDVIGGKAQYHQIYKAFQFLHNFSFSIKENVIQEVRRQLYTLNPVADSYSAPIYNFSNENAGEEVHYYLTSRLAVMEDELRHSIANLYRRPNQTFHAAAEEFYDRITFAVDFNDEKSTFTDMSKVWGDFFMEYNQSVWKEQEEEYSEINNLITRYIGTKIGLEEAVKNLSL